MTKEKSITIRVEEELHTRIKIAVAKKGVTLKDYIISLVEADLDQPKEG